MKNKGINFNRGGSSYIVYRSNNNSNSNGGVAYANANNSPSNTNANIGSRLNYVKIHSGKSYFCLNQDASLHFNTVFNSHCIEAIKLSLSNSVKAEGKKI